MEPQQCSIDGIDTFWKSVAGPLQAALMFRVGAADESFPTVGLTHLLEHLIYARMPVLHHEHNGEVRLFSTSLTLEGSEAEVTDALAGISRAITELAAGRVTAAEIEREVRVLKAEGSGVLPPSVAEILDARFGPVGPGLAAVDETYLDRTTPEQVTAWAAKYFTRENAVLALSGPPPAGLVLELPSGPLPERIKPVMLEGAGRSEYPSLGDEVVISFSIPPSGHGLEYVNGILSRTLRDRAVAQLRRAEGLLYDIEYGVVAGGEQESVVTLQVETAPKQAIEVTRRLLQLIRGLRDEGISAEELQRIIDQGRQDAADERGGFDDACGAAMDRLFGTPMLGREALAEAYAGFSQGDLAAFLTDFESSLIVGIPLAAYGKDLDKQEPEAKLLAFRKHRAAVGITGTSYRRGTRGLFLKVPRDAKLIIGEAGFDFWAEGDSHAYRYQDVVAGMWSTDRRNVFIIGRDGVITELIAEWFKNGAEAIAELQRRLRAHDPLKVVLDADEYELAEEAS